MLRKIQHRRVIIICIAIACGVITFSVSIMVGTINLQLGEIWRALWKTSDNSLGNQIIYNVRLPRILTGFLVGMNLAVAGGLLQGILRNPLAAPHVIGVNAGAGLLAVIVMLFAPGQMHLIPIGAFVGALTAALLVYGLSVHTGTSSTAQIVLAGVAVSAFLSAVTSGLMLLHADELAITYSWLLGSLSGRNWRYFSMLWPYSLFGLMTAVLISPKINLFHLGEEIGSSLGLSVKVYRTLVIIIAAVLAGSAVSVAGTIGFIGLIAPHLARLLVGNDYRYSIILSAVLGGTLLVISDTIARSIFQPVELSVGIVTAILGAPFFLFLLYRKRSLS
ncbi:hypothetical protein TZ02_10550 [Clostridium aceticum]|nr:hypothetical protein TZ02_10550 [Clostridium aceticum]